MGYKFPPFNAPGTLRKPNGCVKPVKMNYTPAGFRKAGGSRKRL